MSLISDQNLFLRDVAKLIQEIQRLGFEVSAGELWRTPEQQAIYLKEGKSKTSNSYHLKRLAIDLNFFKNDVVVEDHASLDPIGKYWESLDPKNKWGGFWKSPVDLPHFERHV